MPIAYDIAVGADETVVNALFAKLFANVYAKGIQDTVPVNEFDIASVTINVIQPPTVSLTAPAHLSTQIKASAATQPQFKNVAANAVTLSAMQAAAQQAAFTLTIPSMDITINYSTGASPTKVNSSVSVGVLVNTNAKDNTIEFQASSGVIDTHDALLNDLLNKAAIPYLLPVIDKKIPPYPLPVLGIKNVTLSVPVLVVQQPYLLAFSALGAVEPDVPAPSTWPTDGLFVSVDANLIQQAGNAFLPINKGDGFGWGPFDGSYNLTIGPISGVNVNSDGTLHVNVGLNANFGITFHTPWPFPNFNFSADAGASVGATGTVNVINDNAEVTLQSVDDPKFNFSWPGIPGWVSGLLNPLLDGLANALGLIIGPIATAALRGHTFQLYTIPPINVPASSLAPGFSIKLNQVQTNENTANGTALLVAHGMPDVAPLQ